MFRADGWTPGYFYKIFPMAPGLSAAAILDCQAKRFSFLEELHWWNLLFWSTYLIRYPVAVPGRGRGFHLNTCINVPVLCPSECSKEILCFSLRNIQGTIARRPVLKQIGRAHV